MRDKIFVMNCYNTSDCGRRGIAGRQAALSGSCWLAPFAQGALLNSAECKDMQVRRPER